MEICLQDLTWPQKEMFVAGWKSAGGYDKDFQDSPYPWAMPWSYQHKLEVKGETPFEWGQNYWNEVKDEVEELLEMEAAI